jgi:heparosan-N-sulfate-glucuronate 5-epimerase
MVSNKLLSNPKQFIKNYPDMTNCVNDLLNPKLSWQFKFDSNGIPFVRYDQSGHFYYNPVTISQYAIGNIQYFYRTGNKVYRSKFVNCAKWLVKNAVKFNDESSGWTYYNNLENCVRMPWFSSMAQGEAISVLCYAYYLEKDTAYLETARRALELLKIPVENGGVLSKDKIGYWFEEFPQIPPSHVLNGHLFTLFGVFSFFSTEKTDDTANFLRTCLASSLKRLHFYDNGYWTIYDLKGKIPVPMSYHLLHVRQMYFLSMLTNIEYFKELTIKWDSYAKRPSCFYRSQFSKLFLMGCDSFKSRKFYLRQRIEALRYMVQIFGVCDYNIMRCIFFFYVR